MDILKRRISKAQECIESLARLTRFIWCANGVAALAGVYYGYYAMAALAAFSGAFSLAATAFARKAFKTLTGGINDVQAVAHVQEMGEIDIALRPAA